MEHIENERALLGKGGNGMGRRKNYKMNLPSQTDESGSAIRIRN